MGSVPRAQHYVLYVFAVKTIIIITNDNIMVVMSIKAAYLYSVDNGLKLNRAFNRIIRWNRINSFACLIIM